MSELFKLIAVITGLTTIKPYFMESSTVLASIVKQRRWENLDNTKMTPNNLEDGLKAWFSQKGFRDNDMVKVEEVAGGITQGMIMLLHVLSRQPAEQSHTNSATRGKREIQWEGWQK